MDIRSDRQKGMSYTEIARKYHIDPRTAKRYAESDTRPVYSLTDSKPSKLDPYKEQIMIWLEEAPYSALRIWEKVQEQGFEGSYSIVKHFVRGKKEQLDEKATVRFETMPGLQAQVDWAFFEDHLVLEDGKMKKLYCFLMVLGYSRMRYIEFVTDMSTSTLIRCHQNAFRYFHGYPEEILYDNMKQVVIKRLLKQEDSTLNRQFEDFAGFYGFKPILCRPYRGQTKGKVERTVAFVRDNFMVGIKYNSLDDLNGQAVAWCNKVNGKVHATTNEIPFERLKKENLNPLSREYIIDKINLRRVQKDCSPRVADSSSRMPAINILYQQNIDCRQRCGSRCVRQYARRLLRRKANRLASNIVPEEGYGCQCQSLSATDTQAVLRCRKHITRGRQCHRLPYTTAELERLR